MNLLHAWGMTELTPIGTVSHLNKELETADASTQLDYKARQGPPVPGVELRVVDGDGKDVPWDGETMGDLVARGPWVTAEYYHDELSLSSYTPDRWFRTRDVAPMQPTPYMEL